MKHRNFAIVALAALAVVVVAATYFPSVYMTPVSDFQSCADAGYPVMESHPMQCRGPDGTVYVQEVLQDNATVNDSELVSYFSDQLWQRGVERLGAMPIEGFDPDLYMGAFPGLQKSDFDNVAAIGGVWTHDAETDELVFGPEPRYTVTSADGTINEEGMPTLLNNIATRLGISVTDQSSVDALLDAIEQE